MLVPPILEGRNAENREIVELKRIVAGRRCVRWGKECEEINRALLGFLRDGFRIARESELLSVDVPNSRKPAFYFDFENLSAVVADYAAILAYFGAESAPFASISAAFCYGLRHAANDSSTSGALAVRGNTVSREVSHNSKSHSVGEEPLFHLSLRRKAKEKRTLVITPGFVNYAGPSLFWMR